MQFKEDETIALGGLRKMDIEQGMNNLETKKHLLEWVKKGHGTFAWPTDACGYDQDVKFAKHRNSNWKGETPEEFKQFIIDYANSLHVK